MGRAIEAKRSKEDRGNDGRDKGVFLLTSPFMGNTCIS